MDVTIETGHRPDAAVGAAMLMAYRALSDLLGKAAFFLVTLAAARRLPQDAFGVFSLGTTIGWIAAVATDFGIQLHTARAVAQQPDRASRLLRAWGRIRLATAALAIVAVGAGLLLTRTPVPIATALFLLAVGYILSALTEFLYYLFRGLSRSDLESTLTIAQRGGTLAIALVALWWRPDVRWLAAGMLIPVALTLWIAQRWARRLAATVSASSRPGGEVTALAAAPGVVAIGAGIVLSALYFRIDILLLNAWAGPSSVALYNAVFRLVDALRLFPAASVAVVLPSIFRADDWRLLARLTLRLGLGATAAALLCGIAAPWLVPALYGARYGEAVAPFRVLLVAFPLMAVNLTLTHQLLGWHGHRAYAVVCGTALVCNLTLNTFLIPARGIVGAAWATVWTEAVVTVGCGAALVALRTRAPRLTERTAC